MGIANDITEIIGNTPLVRINKLAKKSNARIVANEEALETTRLPAKKEGLIVGISSGATVFAALKIADKSENEGILIVVILPYTGERYFSAYSS